MPAIAARVLLVMTLGLPVPGPGPREATAGGLRVVDTAGTELGPVIAVEGGYAQALIVREEQVVSRTCRGS